MVSSATSTWEAFHIDRTRQAKLAETTKGLVTSCQTECKSPHVTKCKKCYPQLLSLMRDRYVTSYDPKDWFAGRTEFIAEIDNMLNYAAVGKTDVQSIDARIMAEKKIWQQFAFPPRDRKLGDQVEKERGKLKDKTDDDLDQVARKIQVSSSKADAYAQIFFAEYPDEMKRKYVDMLQQGKTMTEVCETITEDEAKRKKTTAQLAAERSKLEAELAKLQRAKAASALQKKKKKDAAAQKTRAASIKLPPCAACGAAVNPEKYVHCVICFIFAEAGAIKEKTVYCSPECQQKHVLTHMRDHHCSADTKCIRALEVGTGPDAILPDSTRTEKPVICRECLKEHHLPTLFCEAACAKASFQTHRDVSHLPNRKPEERNRDEAQLEKINFTTYTAKNIRDHVITIDEANKEAKEKDPSLKNWEIPQQAE